ncbi:hypothetical protein C2G38_2218387 [Gigaspora rosea]|uniref:Uncharacterized protein n=1 Tax=Gigaspora rosea TaxID=44941 RepID=A0A397U868_9GLOM|nr:hypothetical protein C2G38_2218387 [Gigaspora rosea]
MKNVKSNDYWYVTDWYTANINKLAQRERCQQQQQAHHLLRRKLLSETSVSPFQLAPLIICVHCNAKKFTGESDGFCCLNRKIVLADVEVPTTVLINLQFLLIIKKK